MKKLLLLTILAVILLAGIIQAQEECGCPISGDKEVIIYDFYGAGCPHCAQMHTFLEDIKEEHPNIKVIEKEIYSNQENRELFEKLSAAYGKEIEGVPTIFIDEKVIVGHSTSIENLLEQEIQRCSTEGCVDPIKNLPEDPTQIIGNSSSPNKPIAQSLTIPAVISAATVDAINPCAFAVLIILLTTILATKSRKKALAAGLAFTISIYISYFLMGIGLFTAIQATGLTHTFYLIVAALAIVVGLFNLKDYLWYGKWFAMEVPMSWRPRMKTILKGITSVPGAFLVGFVISLFLLPCTSGPYIVILGLLAKATSRNYAVLLLLLYNFIFVLPMLIITLAIYFGFTTTEKAEEWRTRKLKLLHLIAGLIILLLGIAMLLSLYFGWI